MFHSVDFMKDLTPVCIGSALSQKVYGVNDIVMSFRKVHSFQHKERIREEEGSHLHT